MPDRTAARARAESEAAPDERHPDPAALAAALEAARDLPVSHREHVFVGGTASRLFLPGTTLRTQDDLCRMLGLEASVVYLPTHRARRQLEAAGIVRASDLVERRTGSGPLRIGVSDFFVVRTAADG